jgi:L-alanine-DL-glutamate epimerase-like enolase superfamily enzyme
VKKPAIDRIDVSAYTIPTDFPESDGTFEWDSTTLILVEAHCGGESGLGYTYGDLATAGIIQRVLAPAIEGRDAMAVSGAWSVMNRLLRNRGRPGAGAMAIGAVDSALWDLKARLLQLPLVVLLGSPSTTIRRLGKSRNIESEDEGWTRTFARFQPRPGGAGCDWI